MHKGFSQKVAEYLENADREEILSLLAASKKFCADYAKQQPLDQSEAIAISKFHNLLKCCAELKRKEAEVKQP